ncbi:MAG: Ribonuclease [Chthoniobacteraceae bacterium]|nr:Ribonuclease [Chthoniobacteraceae bacterium]
MTSPQLPPKTIHTAPLTAAQATHLRALLTERGWKFDTRPYMLYFAQHEKLTVAVYEKGPKIVVQGKGTAEFVQFILEPEIIGEAKLGYEEISDPAMFEPHFGIDESGKGDFFGPLVIAGAYVDRGIARTFLQAGIQDSKRIGSDKKIRDFAELIRHTPGSIPTVVVIGPERYNQLYEKFGNLNRLLAWGHARVIENLLERRPDCPRALSDQFANPKLIERALLEKGRGITLDQRTKAESDLAVAAASILAREGFIDWLQKNGRTFQREFPRGASAAVKTTARELAGAHGPEILHRLAKTHFKTAAEVAPEYFGRPSLPGADDVV